MSKAPDKIYLPIVQGRTRKDIRYDATYFAPTEFAEENIEYIRKEALLEWANVHKTVIETNGEEDDAYTRGQYSVILTLIDKLNSM